MSNHIFKNELLNFLKDIKKNNEQKIKKFLIDINNQIVDCKCKLIAECNYVIDKLLKELSAGSISIKNKMENWIINNTDHYCARTRWVRIDTLKTQEEDNQEEEIMLNKLYFYLLTVISSEITINKKYTIDDINDILNNFNKDDYQIIEENSKEIYTNLNNISNKEKEIKNKIILKKKNIITVLKNNDNNDNDDTQDRSSTFAYQQKATFKEITGLSNGKIIFSGNMSKKFKNISKHLGHIQVNPEDISKKDEEDIIKLCSDKLINLSSDKTNIDSVKNLWKVITNSNKDKKSIRNKIYFIAYAIKLLFPDKSYSSLATAIRTIIGIDATTEPLYNIDNNIVNIDVYDYYNNFLKTVSDTEEYKDLYKRNETNRKIVVDPRKIISLIRTNAYDKQYNNTENIKDAIKDARSESILRIERLLDNGSKEISSKYNLAKEITRLINLRLKYFEINDTIKEMCRHCELTIANTNTKIKFTTISVDIILSLL